MDALCNVIKVREACSQIVPRILQFRAPEWVDQALRQEHVSRLMPRPLETPYLSGDCREANRYRISWRQREAFALQRGAKGLARQFSLSLNLAQLQLRSRYVEPR